MVDICCDVQLRRTSTCLDGDENPQIDAVSQTDDGDDNSSPPWIVMNDRLSGAVVGHIVFIKFNRPYIIFPRNIRNSLNEYLIRQCLAETPSHAIEVSLHMRNVNEYGHCYVVCNA